MSSHDVPRELRYAHSYVLSPEQLRAWSINGYLMLRGGVPEGVAARLSAMADALAALPKGEPETHPWMVRRLASMASDSLRVPSSAFDGLRVRHGRTRAAVGC